MMKKALLIAAGMTAAMCSVARASGGALEALRGSVSENVSIEIPAAGPALEIRRGGGVYANASGCTVTVVRGEYGSTLAVRDGRQEAVLGVANDFSRGDIHGYCGPAAVARKGTAVNLSCGKQDNGFFRTRGQAEIEMSEEGVTSVKVRGEVRRALVWFTDKEIVCDGLKPAGGGSGFNRDASAQTLIDGWLDEKHHDHIAKDPNGSGLNTVLYVTLVKSDDKLYLQAFLPGHGSYLADFITSPAFAHEDLAALRSDQGHPYLVAFETYSTTVPRTNMLVVQFNGEGMLRFAIVQKFPTSEIKGGKFKPYVPADADRKAWSPWTDVK